MRHLNPCLLDCQQAHADFSSAVMRWLSAGAGDVGDVKQEIALAALAGFERARAVPAGFGIRRLATGSWVADDPAARPYEEFGIGGIQDVAKDFGVSVWCVQQLVAAQRDCYAANGDLFEGAE